VVEQNDALAVAWWQKGAEGDDATSQYNLGRGYALGMFGLPENAQCAKIFTMVGRCGLTLSNPC
jgi:TPR repeat protein